MSRSISPEGKVEVLLENSGGVKDKTPGVDQGSDGMVPDKDNTVLVCLQGGRKIVSHAVQL